MPHIIHAPGQCIGFRSAIGSFKKNLEQVDQKAESGEIPNVIPGDQS